MAKNDFQLLDSAMWHDHDIDFASWLHTAGTCLSALLSVKCESTIDSHPAFAVAGPRVWNSSVQFSSLHS